VIGARITPMSERARGNHLLILLSRAASRTLPHNARPQTGIKYC